MNLYEKQARLLRAIAHPTRLRILEIISEEESCVCHITTILKRRQPYVSQQLMILREAGLVLDRKDGVMVYYRPADKRITEAIVRTRDILRATGDKVDFPPVPKPPVSGCPCPECENSGPWNR